MPTTCFITGGAGNLACQLTHLLAEQFDRLVLFDLATQPVAEVAEHAVYVRGDLTAHDTVRGALAEYRPQCIVHLASMLSGNCEENRARGWQVNADGTFALLEAAVALGVKKFFFPSSLATYGGALPDALDEDHPQWPDSLYGVTKLACERLGVYYQRRHGLDFRGLRLPIVISRFAPAGAASAYASRAFVEAAETGRFVFRVRPTTAASVMYVRDALQAIARLLAAPQERLTRRVYNIHVCCPTAAELAAAIQQRLPQAQLTFEPKQQIADLIESWPKIIDDRSARSDWGWQPKYDLDTMADDILAELRQ